MVLNIQNLVKQMYRADADEKAITYVVIDDKTKQPNRTTKSINKTDASSELTVCQSGGRHFIEIIW